LTIYPNHKYCCYHDVPQRPTGQPRRKRRLPLCYRRIFPKFPSQLLGAWLNNVFYPTTPKIGSINPFGDYINLFNSDFNDFREKTNIGKDFKFLLNTIIPVEDLLKKIVIDDSNNGIIYTKEQ
jgi:hypothetical protein